MRYHLILLCFCISCIAHAQNKLHYAGSIEGGLLAGSKPYSSFISLKQGVAYRQFSFSIGGGYDFYRVRSLPLFAEVSKSFTRKPVQPFVQAAAGVNIVSPTGSEKNRSNYYNYSGSYDNGLYAKAGGGLLFRANKKWQFLLSAGYTIKTTAYIYHPLTPDIYPYDTEPIKDKYYFKRWSLGVGIMW